MPSESEIEAQVRELFQPSLPEGFDHRSIGRSQNLFEIGVDSLEIVRVVLDIEVIFDLELDEEDLVLDNFSSFDAVIRLVTMVLGRSSSNE